MDRINLTLNYTDELSLGDESKQKPSSYNPNQMKFDFGDDYDQSLH
jgi:hypothetical protein